MKGEDLRNEWAHQGEGGKAANGEIRVRNTSGTDGGVDRQQRRKRKDLSDLRNN